MIIKLIRDLSIGFAEKILRNKASKVANKTIDNNKHLSKARDKYEKGERAADKVFTKVTEKIL